MAKGHSPLLGAQARLWVQLMRELRHGVKLKKVQEQEFNPLPTEFQLTPFEMLMQDIRARNYKLRKVMVSGRCRQAGPPCLVQATKLSQGPNGSWQTWPRLTGSRRGCSESRAGRGDMAGSGGPGPGAEAAGSSRVMLLWPLPDAGITLRMFLLLEDFIYL